MPFSTKELSKATMTRSRLGNNCLKNRNGTNRLLYTKQRNYCLSLLKKTKKTYKNLNERCVTDKKPFWETVKAFLSEKVLTRDKIYLTKNGKTI